MLGAHGVRGILLGITAGMILGIIIARGGPIPLGTVRVGDLAGVVFMPDGQVRGIILGMVRVGDGMALIGDQVTGVVAIGGIITIIMLLLTVIVRVVVPLMPAVTVAVDAVQPLPLIGRTVVVIATLLRCEDKM